MPRVNCTAENPDQEAHNHPVVFEDAHLEQGLNPARRLLHMHYRCPNCGLRVTDSQSAFVLKEPK
jgi:hypothetical protein